MRPANTPSAQPPKLPGQVRGRIRVKRYSGRMETQYVQEIGTEIGDKPRFFARTDPEHLREFSSAILFPLLERTQ